MAFPSRRCVEAMSTTFPPVYDPQRSSPLPRGEFEATPSGPDATAYPADAEEVLGMLDFPALRRALATHVRFGPAKARAALISPSFDALTVAELHAETVQGRRFLAAVGDLDLTLEVDASDSVDRAALGGVVTGEELVAIAEAMAVHSRAAALAGRAAAVAPTLASIAGRIPDLSDVEVTIGRAISTRGDVKDGATPELRSLRARVRSAYGGVTAALSRMIDSNLQSALQDRVISLRAERFVLQVRSEMRHRIPGIVHDASKTGSTVYVEPLATVELGNLWRELVLEEEREVARILARLSELVGRSAAAFALGSELTAQIDLILARARHGVRTEGITPPAARDDQLSGRPGMRLVAARHPLLGDGAIPVSVQLGKGSPNEREWSVLVVTGPNTGGKTVAMKTVGLLVAMNQSGLQVPAAEGSVLAFYDSLHVDLGDRQSIERSVSTFSSHMGRVIGILEKASPGSLVLLDELGSSTDPEEGAALARAVLDRLAGRCIPAVVTTHHRSVAAHAETAPGMENASVELDPETLAPTYRLTMGVPGRSYAMAVAAGLGMPSDVLGAAESYLDPRSARYEQSMEELRRARAAVDRVQADAEASAASAERARIELEAERAALVARKNELAEAMHAQLASRYGELTKRLRRAEAALSWNIGHSASVLIDRSLIESVGEDLSVAKEGLTALEDQARPAADPVVGRPDNMALNEGAVVEVRGLGATGTVQTVYPDTGQVEVLIGSVRLRIDSSRLVPTGVHREVERPSVTAALGPALESGELDLRGMRAERAESEVDLFLDRAVRDGLSSVRIVHGRATGALRRVVRERLDRHPLVRSFAAEAPERGGEGSTRADLV